jgi:hypothetical protein
VANNYGASGRLDLSAINDFVYYLFNLLNFDAWPIEVRYCIPHKADYFFTQYRSKPILYLEVGSWLFDTISDFGIRSDESVFLSILVFLY